MLKLFYCYTWYGLKLILSQGSKATKKRLELQIRHTPKSYWGYFANRT